MEEEYNPKIHCCPDWYLDFCQCVKSGLREMKKRAKKRNVNSTLNFLKKNNIGYAESKIPNIVIINPGKDNVMLSLKRQNGLFKCRYMGKAKWYTFGKSKFIEKFSTNVVKVQH